MKWLLSVCLMCVSATIFAQANYTGTYYWQSKTGASATITIVQSGNNIETDVFAWWHTASERHGIFSGTGKLNTNKSSIIPDTEWSDIDPNKDCKVNFIFSNDQVNANFGGCITYNLPEDFNGHYKKIANNIKGIYVVNTDKSALYKEMKTTSKHAAYLIKGDTVLVENIETNNWAYTNYTNQHNHTTSGFLQLKTLQFIRYKP